MKSLKFFGVIVSLICSLHLSFAESIKQSKEINTSESRHEKLGLGLIIVGGIVVLSTIGLIIQADKNQTGDLVSLTTAASAVGGGAVSISAGISILSMLDKDELTLLRRSMYEWAMTTKMNPKLTRSSQMSYTVNVQGLDEEESLRAAELVLGVVKISSSEGKNLEIINFEEEANIHPSLKSSLRPLTPALFNLALGNKSEQKWGNLIEDVYLVFGHINLNKLEVAATDTI